LWFKKVVSDVEKVNIRVPQGSLLGPLLFIVYVNDILDSVKIGYTVMFVDDLSILMQCDSEDELESTKKKCNLN